MLEVCGRDARSCQAGSSGTCLRKVVVDALAASVVPGQLLRALKQAAPATLSQQALDLWVQLLQLLSQVGGWVGGCGGGGRRLNYKSEIGRAHV